MATYKEIGEKLTNIIVSAIERGDKLPWIKPWKGGCNILGGGAVSYATGKPYSFFNQIFLGGQGEWVTFNKCKELGGSVKKGAKGTVIYFAKMITKSEIGTDGKSVVKTFPIFQNYLVFNIDDCEGLEKKWTTEKVEEPKVISETDAVAEMYIANYVSRSGIKFINNINSAQAFYMESEDKVVVPNKEQFTTMNEYYSTTFHELTHSTLTKERCNRPQDEEGKRACFGNAPYAKEELVAELGACMLLASMGLSTETTERNSTAYLQSWLKALKNDTSLILWASSRAEKAVQFIRDEKAESGKNVA